MKRINFQKVFFGEYEEKKKKSNASSKATKENAERSFYGRVVVSVVLLLSLISFVYASVFFYPRTDRNVAEHESTINLTKNSFMTKYWFGPSNICPNENECWAKQNYDDSDWKTVNLPNTRLSGLPDYKDGTDRWIYYRINLKIPKTLVDNPDEIAFSPLYIRHEKYEIYVNGTKVITGNMKDSNSKLLVISIPKEQINQFGEVTVGIKGTLFSKSETGLSHRGQWMLGLETELSKLHLHLERATNTFYLLFLLTKGGIIAIFSIVFIFTTGQKGMFAFLIFAVFSTLESLLIGKFLTGYIPSTKYRLFLTFYCKTIAYIGLYAYFLNYWNVKNIKKYVAFALPLFLALISFALYSFNNGGFFDVVSILHLTNIQLITTLLFSIFIGTISFQMWKNLQLDSEKLVPIRNMIIANILYLLLVVHQSFFSGQYEGFDIRPLFDLFFFLYVAIEIMQSFGNTEKRVVSLEGHMIEKSRMQQELEDAREISKAFLPTSIPQWEQIEISIFHKSLSENSGDWYAFETSPSGRFKYFFMCDVTGHGVQAAIVVSTCRAILIALKNRKDRRNDGIRFIESYITELNKTLFYQGNGYHLTTVSAIAFDMEESMLYHVSAGHPFPLRVRNSNDPKKKIVPIIGPPNTNLGFKDELNLEIKSEKIENNDIVMIYTDGLLIEKNIRKIRDSFSINHNAFSEYSGQFVEMLKKIQEEKNVQLVEEDDLTLVSFKLQKVALQNQLDTKSEELQMIVAKQ